MSDELIAQLDEFAAEHDYPGRSAMIREAARTFFEEIEETDFENHTLVGLITVFFSYETTDIEERLMDLRHEHDELVVANVHNHMRNRHCLELFVLEGDLEALSGFVETVRSMKGPLRVEHSMMPIDKF